MTSPNPILIQLPRGDTATFEDMEAYGQTLQAFIRQQEEQLPDERDVTRHNEIVDYLNLLASGYNEQLRLFKEAEARRRSTMLLSLMRYVGG